MNAKMKSKLMILLGSIGQATAGDNASLQVAGSSLKDIGQAGLQAEAQRKEAKKGRSSGLGSMIGTIGGIALAPLTGGASLAATAAMAGAGSALGGAAESALVGEKITPQSLMMNAAMGASTPVLSSVMAPLAVGAKAAPAGVAKAATGAPLGSGALAATKAAGSGMSNPMMGGLINSASTNSVTSAAGRGAFLGSLTAPAAAPLSPLAVAGGPVAAAKAAAPGFMSRLGNATVQTLMTRGLMSGFGGYQPPVYGGYQPPVYGGFPSGPNVMRDPNDPNRRIVRMGGY